MTSPPAEAPSRPPVRRQGFDLAALARRSPVSLGLIAVNLGVFGLQLLLTNWLGFDLVISAGAKENSAIAAGQYWRLLTPVLPHAGFTFARQHVLLVHHRPGDREDVWTQEILLPSSC